MQQGARAPYILGHGQVIKIAYLPMLSSERWPRPRPSIRVVWLILPSPAECLCRLAVRRLLDVAVSILGVGARGHLHFDLTTLQLRCESDRRLPLDCTSAGEETGALQQPRKSWARHMACGNHHSSLASLVGCVWWWSWWLFLCGLKATMALGPCASMGRGCARIGYVRWNDGRGDVVGGSD